MVTITALTAADRDDWTPLWQGYLTFYESAVSDEVTDDVYRRLVDADVLHGALARDDEGRAVGIVHWLYHPATWAIGPSCYLEDLFVSPDVRGGGVGGALIAHVRAHAVEAGATKVYWLTQRDNTTARALYDRVATESGFVHYQIGL
ncbi:GNAT family N-acetyltransferase [Microbacterium sp. VKM Ac-2870]|uniref:GNAT family N-acetyltransferase n=1 Tax=Microbacterium sp. VKM Ac-2870 TaxID=2783825 RepID=UPI00188AE101|nr:GNAT family N-acetyltransferase [Microbacterium sp. VKM Ac-2870]MBF4560642.1 GNAT family N-acetyltransferase [Microbacterium sp. VKM Ac-2870]